MAQHSDYRMGSLGFGAWGLPMKVHPKIIVAPRLQSSNLSPSRAAVLRAQARGQVLSHVSCSVYPAQWQRGVRMHRHEDRFHNSNRPLVVKSRVWSPVLDP